MSDAPETKMLTPNGGLPTGAWGNEGLIKYVRYDLVDAKDARIAELEARNTALGEAVAHATQRFTKAESALGKISLRMELNPDEMQRIARATLADIKEEQDDD